MEGSLENEKAGEYGIDLCEYIDTGSANDIDYYQLKHTTVRSEAPFQLAGLKDTITHFAARFRQHTLESDFALRRIHFRLVTNRVVDTTVKQNLKKIVGGNPVDKRFLATLTKYTEIKGNELKAFCERLPVGSFGIHYDCFGSGAYRNRSTQRHRHRDGLVQIANELASRGLCPSTSASSS